MPKTLSTDLRERIVRHVSEGHSRRSAPLLLCHPVGFFSNRGLRSEYKVTAFALGKQPRARLRDLGRLPQRRQFFHQKGSEPLRCRP